jgi:hypothetical protein
MQHIRLLTTYHIGAFRKFCMSLVISAGEINPGLRGWAYPDGTINTVEPWKATAEA